MSEGGDGYAGQLGPQDDAEPFNAQVFLVQQVINRLSTATVVKVTAQRGGGTEPVGFVDVLPLVNLLDGVGKSFKHGTVQNLAYFRLQGGVQAVIIDPKVGDIGIAIFADRDISAVKKTKAQANPGSLRRFDMADGLYVGGVLNGAPEMWVRFFNEGIELTPDSGTTKLTLTAGVIRLEANEVQVHSRNKTTLDADGTGYVLNASGKIDTYANTGESHPSHPPEVPT